MVAWVKSTKVVLDRERNNVYGWMWCLLPVHIYDQSFFYNLKDFSWCDDLDIKTVQVENVP